MPSSAASRHRPLRHQQARAQGTSDARLYRLSHDYTDRPDELDLSPAALAEWELYEARNAIANLAYRMRGELGRIDLAERRKIGIRDPHVWWS